MQSLTEVINSGCSCYGRDAERQPRPGLRVAVVAVPVLRGSRVLNDPVEPTERAAVDQRGLPIRISNPGKDRVLVVVQQRHADLLHVPEEFFSLENGNFVVQTILFKNENPISILVSEVLLRFI